MGGCKWRGLGQRTRPGRGQRTGDGANGGGKLRDKGRKGTKEGTRETIIVYQLKAKLQQT